MIYVYIDPASENSMTSVVAERESQPLPPEPQTSENYGELRVVLQALRRNRTAFASVILIAVVIFGAVFAPLHSPIRSFGTESSFEVSTS